MIDIDGGKNRMVHVSVLRAAGNVKKLEFHNLPVWRRFPGHAGPVSRVTVMCQHQAIPSR